MRSGRDNRLGSEWIKKEMVHWLMGKGDGRSLVCSKSRLVKERQGKPASGFGIFFHQAVKFL